MVGHTQSKVAAGAVLVLGFVVAVVVYVSRTPMAVLDPAGPIALQERNLIIFAASLSLLVVIPVFAMTFAFAWRYREGNTQAKYSPNLDGSRIAETIWWLIPSALILVLSVVAWNSSHSLDPYKPLASSVPPITVQVVALDWKWLFIYPQQHIATVNFVQFPKNTPVAFEITADAPMNSFWIPRLGGQIYAMPGMSTQLHLMATETGSFRGASANISGDGFAGMAFVAKSTSQADFNQWVATAQRSPQLLDQATYNQLAQPSEYNAPATYALGRDDLYNTTIMKYMGSMNQMAGMEMPGMGTQ